MLLLEVASKVFEHGPLDPEDIADFAVPRCQWPICQPCFRAHRAKLAARIEGQFIAAGIQNAQFIDIDFAARLGTGVASHPADEFDCIVELDVEFLESAGRHDALDLPGAVMHHNESGAGENSKPKDPAANQNGLICVLAG